MGRTVNEIERITTGDGHGAQGVVSGARGEVAIMFGIFALIHLILHLMEIGGGATVLLGLLTGELLMEWFICFLKIRLVASIASLLATITGFTSSAHHVLPAEQASIALSSCSGSGGSCGAQISLGRRLEFGLYGYLTMIPYLKVFVVSGHAFENKRALNVLAPAHSIKRLSGYAAPCRCASYGAWNMYSQEIPR